MFWLDTIPLPSVVGPLPDDPLFLGALGLSLGATVGAWVEVWRLRYALRDPMPKATVPWAALLRMTALALGSLLPAAGVWWGLPAGPVLLVAPLVVGAYAVVYLGIAFLLGFDEIEAWTRRFLR
jgi:putative peptidoglycan lipid II flippase